MGKRKGFFLTGVVVLLLVTFLFGACGEPAKEAPVETITWKYASYIPETTGCGEITSWILDEIEERSGGRIVFERYWSAALGSPTEYPQMLKGNLIQMAILGPGYTPEIFKLTRGVGLQYLTEDSEAFAAAVVKLYDSYQPFQDEWTNNGMKFFYPNVAGKMMIQSRSPAYTWEDFKGKQVRTYGPHAVLWNEWGANTISIPFSEAYEALQRGTIDIVTDMMFASMAGMKFYEVAPYCIDAGFGADDVYAETISLKAWDALPDDIKNIFEEVKRDLLKVRWTDIEPKWDQTNIALSDTVTFIQWSEQERERAKNQAMPAIRNVYLDEMEKEGLPGTEFVERLEAEIKEYRDANPNKLWEPPTYKICKGAGIYHKGEWSPLP